MILRSLALLTAFALCAAPCGAESVETAPGTVVETSFESGGVPLKAYLHKHSGGETRALVIYLHGNPGGKLGTDSALASTLGAAGVDVFRFNYRGLWGNEGDFNLKNAIGDLDAALSFLTAPETVDKLGLQPAPIVLVGYSFGTATALVGARGDARVSGIVSLAPCDHGYFGGEWLDPNSKLRGFLEGAVDSIFGEGGPVDQDPAIFMDDLTENMDAYVFPAHAEALLDKKLLFLVAIDDAVCLPEDHFFPLYRRLQALGHSSLEARVLNMNHGFKGVGVEGLMQITGEWLGRETTGAGMSLEDMTAFATRYAAAWSSQDPDKLASFYSEKGLLRVNEGEPAVGRAAIAAKARAFMEAFPDMVVRLDSLKPRPGGAEFHWRWTGTNTGPGGTGRAVDLTGFEAWTFDSEGLIAKSLGSYDAAEYERQVSGESGR